MMARLLRNGLPYSDVFLPRDKYKLKIDGMNNPPHAPQLKNLNHVVAVSEPQHPTKMSGFR